MGDTAKEFVAEVCAITGWAEQECRNFLNSIESTSSEQLREDAAFAVEYAIKAERRAALIDVIKTMGRALRVTVKDGDLIVGFRDQEAAGRALLKARGQS